MAYSTGKSVIPTEGLKGQGNVCKKQAKKCREI